MPTLNYSYGQVMEQSQIKLSWKIQNEILLAKYK